MIDGKKPNPNSRASARGKPKERLLVPDDAIIRIELEVEERVRKSITQLVTSREWADILRRRRRPRQFDTDTRQQRRELLLIVASFARKYKALLENAVVEYCREIGQAYKGAGLPSTPTDAAHSWQRGCQFAERFTIGEYVEPWGGFFMLKPSPTAYPSLRDDEAEVETIAGEFQEANPLARLFDDAARSVKVAAEAEGLTGPEYVRREYSTYAHGWKKDSASRARNQFLIVTATMPKEPAHARSQRVSKAGAIADPEVAKRRSLVRANADLSAQEMCELFDRQRVPLPIKWRDAGFSSWARTYEKSEFRRRIRVLISKDKQHS